MKQIYRCILSEDLIHIRSEVKFLPKFPPLCFLPEHSINSKDTPKVCLTVLLGNDLSWKGFQPGIDPYFEERIVNNLKVLMGARDLDSKDPILAVNQLYYKLVRVRIGNLYPLGNCVKDFLQMKLLKENLLLLHCDIFASENKGFILFGTPNVKRTTVLFGALKQGYDYVSDDLSILDKEGSLHACSGVSSLAFDLREISRFFDFKLGRLKNLTLKLKESIPFLGFMRSWPFVEISSLLPQVNKVSKVKPLAIFFLTRGSPKLTQLTPEQALDFAIKLNRLEFSYFENQMVNNMFLLKSPFDLRKSMKTEEKLLKQFVYQSTCYLCVAPNPKVHLDLIMSVV